MFDWMIVGLISAEIAAAILAGATALRVRAYYRLVEAPSLRRFGVGFVLLGVAQAAAATLELLMLQAGETLARDRFDFLDVAFWIHYTALIAGLLLVFASFGRHPFRWAPAFAPLLLVVGPVLQLLIILVLFFVVLHAGLNHIARKGAGSILVAVGFFFVFAAQTMNLIGYSPLQPRWLLAELVNVAGFILLYLSVKLPRSVSDG